MSGLRATIQLCTYNRAALLDRVLDACFEQTVSADAYEVVVVNDGSSDGTAEVIERARHRATCAFTAIHQTNSGLAKGRNAGIAAAVGTRIIFIDDDVLPLPNFVLEHLRSHEERPLAIVRGGAINVESFDDLPPPIWTPLNYSGNYFWTTNVSVPLATIRAIGGFNETFAEYGWEDIDVGLRLRFGGVRAVFNKRALVYHWKPQPTTASVPKMIRQAQAQARTAVRLAELHPHWRTFLATADTPAHRLLQKWMRGIRAARAFDSTFFESQPDRRLTKGELRAAKRLTSEAYFNELQRAKRAAR